MDALILAAGFGSRLGNLTSSTPKPMLLIEGTPLLGNLVDKCRKIGCDRIFVNVHYHHKIIENYIESINKGDLHIIYENKILGTAGSVKNVYLNYEISDLVVMHGDNYFQDELWEIKNNFERKSNMIHGVVGYFFTEHPSKCGIFTLNSENIVIDFREKSQTAVGKIANSAIYIFSGEVLKIILQLDENENDISKHLIPKLLGKLKAVELKGFFIDIGTPETLKLARNLKR
jgi:mannose-1-phosphate guanylyltransferase